MSLEFTQDTQCQVKKEVEFLLNLYQKIIINNKLKKAASFMILILKVLTTTLKRINLRNFAQEMGTLGILFSLIEKSYHLVEFQTKYNNIMNTISPEGRIKIRANDIASSKDITDKLKSMGLEVLPHQEKTSKPK